MSNALANNRLVQTALHNWLVTCEAIPVLFNEFCLCDIEVRRDCKRLLDKCADARMSSCPRKSIYYISTGLHHQIIELGTMTRASALSFPRDYPQTEPTSVPHCPVFRVHASSRRTFAVFLLRVTVTRQPTVYK